MSFDPTKTEINWQLVTVVAAVTILGVLLLVWGAFR
jgi:hypothetical protein